MRNLGEGLDMAAVSMTGQKLTASILIDILQYMGIYT